MQWRARLNMPVTLPPKPKSGEPCNGCGQCCALEICEGGAIAFPGGSAPCPGLVILDGRTRCKLVMTEIIYNLEPVMQAGLTIGHGCTEDWVDEWKEKTR